MDHLEIQARDPGLLKLARAHVLLSSSVPHILIVLKHGRTRRPWGRFHPAAHEVVSIWNQPEDSPSITYYAALGLGFSDGIMERNT